MKGSINVIVTDVQKYKTFLESRGLDETSHLWNIGLGEVMQFHGEPKHEILRYGCFAIAEEETKTPQK